MEYFADKIMLENKPERTKEIICRRKWSRQWEKQKSGDVLNMLKKQHGCVQGRITENYSRSKTDQFGCGAEVDSILQHLSRREDT